MNITDTSRELFVELAKDAINWAGAPLLGGNVPADKHTRGNVTQLKKAGLIWTEVDEGNTWVYFTDEGRSYARELGVYLYERSNWDVADSQVIEF